MSFEIKGTVKKLFDQQDFPSGFYKRDFVITTQEQYPQDLKFSALKEKSEQLSGVQEGSIVNVKFDVRGREYNGNYYVDLNAWRVEPMTADAGGGAQQVPPAQDAPPIPTTPPDFGPADDDDDLPF